MWSSWRRSPRKLWQCARIAAWRGTGSDPHVAICWVWGMALSAPAPVAIGAIAVGAELSPEPEPEAQPPRAPAAAAVPGWAAAARVGELVELFERDGYCVVPVRRGCCSSDHVYPRAQPRPCPAPLRLSLHVPQVGYS